MTALLRYFITFGLGLAERESRRGGIQRVESSKAGKQWLRCKSRGAKENCGVSCKGLEVTLQVLGD